MQNAAIGLALIIGVPVGIFIVTEIRWREIAASWRRVLTQDMDR